MSKGKSRSEGEPGQPEKFGIARLSARGIAVLFEFVDDSLSLERRNALMAEWQQVTSRDPQGMATKVIAMGRAEDVTDRIISTHVVPYLAEKLPDQGYALWRDLLQDNDETVRDAAIQAVADTLGILNLDAEQVVGLIELHNQVEIERGRYAPNQYEHPPDNA